MTEDSSDIEQLEQETPGFKKQYEANFTSLGERRSKQGIERVDLKHLQQEAIDFTKKDIDQLTGALKREVALEKIEELSKELSETGEDVMLGFVDLDYLRKINEEKGHRAGDHAMKLVGRIVRKSIRENDILGRYGGDELIIVFRNTNQEEAQQLISERLFPSLIEGVNISVGLTKLHPSGMDRAIKEADAAMYTAKTTGHETKTNQVRTFDELTPEEKANTKFAA